jgi:sarcosine oxidase, subunit delta
VLLIECPWCGPRDEIEFRWGCERGVTRPAAPASDADWADYLYFRRNPKGASDELWVHAGGCRQWFAVRRDTASHRIVSTHPLRERLPEASGGGTAA